MSFLGFHNTLPQFGGVKQEKFTLLVLEARSAKSKCQQSHAPLKSLKKNTFLPLPTSIYPRGSLVWVA